MICVALIMVESSDESLDGDREFGKESVRVWTVYYSKDLKGGV